MSILQVVNEEQLLDFALTYINELDPNKDPHEVADYIIIKYIIDDFKLNNVEYDEDMIIQRYKELITEHVLTSLVKKGALEVEIEDGITYKIKETK